MAMLKKLFAGDFLQFYNSESFHVIVVRIVFALRIGPATSCGKNATNNANSESVFAGFLVYLYKHQLYN